MADENETETRETVLRTRRKKRDTVMPQTVTGWSVMLVAVLCGTGVALVALDKSDIALSLFGVAGWGGYIMKLLGKDRE